MPEPADRDAALLAALTRIDARLDQLERRLGQLEATTSALPAALSVAANTLDNLARRTGEAEFDARLRAALSLVERLSEPRVAAGLEALAAHGPAVAGLASAAPEWIATFANVGDGLAARFDADARVAAALPVLDRLTRPENLAALEALVARLPELTGLLLGTPAWIATFTNLFDGVALRLAARGIDVDQRVALGARVLERLTSPEALDALGTILSRVDEIHALVESGVFDPRAVAVVASAGTAMAATRSDAPPPVGAFALLGALRDPDVQRAAGFAVAFARRFGRNLDSTPTS